MDDGEKYVLIHCHLRSSSQLNIRFKARNALATLSEIAMAYDQDGIDIYFLNESTTEGQNITVRS